MAVLAVVFLTGRAATTDPLSLRHSNLSLPSPPFLSSISMESLATFEPSAGAPSPPCSTPRFYFGAAKASPPVASVWSFGDNNNRALRPVPPLRLELLQHSASLQLSDLLSKFTIAGSTRALSPVAATGSPLSLLLSPHKPKEIPWVGMGKQRKVK